VATLRAASCLSVDDGNLPAGDHEASWREVVKRLGTTPWRFRLVVGLLEALKALHLAGCARVYVNGSFVKAKENPVAQARLVVGEPRRQFMEAARVVDSRL
jgi:hypothetical protein